MKRYIYWMALVSFAAAAALCAYLWPAALSDENEFLKNLTNEQLIPILGIMVTITLGSASQVHLALNSIEERHNRLGFSRTRAQLKSAIYAMLALFTVAVGLSVAKPIWGSANLYGQAYFNTTAAIIVFWNVLVLWAITRSVFAVKAIVITEAPHANTIFSRLLVAVKFLLDGR